MATTSDSNGEHPEFDQLLASHQGRLYGFIRSLTGPGLEVDDLLQNTNRVLVEKAETFELGTNFRAWAFQVARYQVMQFREKQSREGQALPFSDELSETLAVRAEEKENAYARRQQSLKHCLQQLPERQREVIERRYFQNESVQTIADALDLKPNAISQLLFRGRDNLLHCIEGQLGNCQFKTEEFFDEN
ncbi:MAG: sigma-70 family RNA polymerase sigma factor [Verrucomicrobiota bacterium]